MESRTKNKQDQAVIFEMAKRAFGENGEYGVKELKEGFYNAAYEVMLPSGKEVILKIAPPKDAEVMGYENDIMRTEVDTMRLARKQADVPVPEVFFYDDSHELCESDYFFMEKLDGESYSSHQKEMSDEEKAQIEYQAGQYNRELNKIEGTYFGYPGTEKLQSASWKDAFGRIMEDLLQDGEKKQADIGLPYDEIRQIMAECGDCLLEVETPRFVHWDLWAGNIFIKEGKVTGFIDFERTLWADPLVEHDFMWITRDCGETPFLKGYGKTEFTPGEMLRRRLYNLHLFLIMTIECYYRHYDDNSQYAWSKDMLLGEVELLKKARAEEHAGASV